MGVGEACSMKGRRNVDGLFIDVVDGACIRIVEMEMNRVT